MKVHFKVTAYDRLMEKIAAGQREGRRVEYITMYAHEYAELRDDTRACGRALAPSFLYVSRDIGSPARGTVTHHRQFRVRPHSVHVRGDYYTVVEDTYTFMGFPIYVLPDFCEE